ncbi:hypothetical protein BDV3_000622 [Batrachochytrium dendrobatidis]|nr:hypothetical protein O5D80_000503 [Batrachochytrium dendrobatidis]KAK5672042.1 hypothetical protein QVD99_001860 [Batrachochytrium dendrobatidis]
MNTVMTTRKTKRTADEESVSILDGLKNSLQKMELRPGATKMRTQVRHARITQKLHSQIASAAEPAETTALANTDGAEDELDDATYEFPSNDDPTEDTCTDADMSMGLDLDDENALETPGVLQSLNTNTSLYKDFVNTPKELNEPDGESDYCPSDVDTADIHLSRKILATQRAQKYCQRAHTTFSDLCRFHYTPPMTPPSGYWIARLSKYNLERKRWANKGPVLVYFLEDWPARFVGNYLYGSRSVAFNIQLFETLEKFYSVHDSRITINTQGHNTISKAYIQTESVPLNSYFPEAATHGNLPVYKCESVIVPENEQVPSLISLCFQNQQDAYHVTQYTSNLVMACRSIAIAKRVATFVQPHKVAGHPNHATVISSYSNDGEFTQKLAANGLYYFPQYNSMKGTVDDFTKCIWCGTEFPPFPSSQCNINVIHAEGEAAERLNCPYVGLRC